MEYNQDDWLPHLMNAVPLEARKNQISMYTIALEGWRRGLRLSFYSQMENEKLQINYALSNDKKKHHFSGSGGDYNSETALRICENKDETYEYLEKAQVSVPKGRTFGKDTPDEEIINISSKMKLPLVVKPTDGSAGKGVISNIKNTEALKKAVNTVRNRFGYQNIIVQEYIKGEEVRVFVLGNTVAAAANRRPANIVGDGIRTIKMLIDEKNKIRQAVPHLHFRPIKADKELSDLILQSNYTLDSILKKGERLYLRNVSNLAKGGEPIDVTDALTAGQKETAVKAAGAIPGLSHCGVDMILDDTDHKAAKVIEINSRPGIGSHLFPIEGKARDIPKLLIDYYFPETSYTDGAASNLYFDLGTVMNALKGRSLVRIEVPSMHSSRLFAVKYIVSAEIDIKRFHQWMQNQSLKHGFHGSLKELSPTRFEMVIAGENRKDVEKWKPAWNKIYGFHLQIEEEKEWEQPIGLGFKLISDHYNLDTSELEDKLKEINNEIKRTTAENNRLQRRITLMTESKAWKYTKPLRAVRGFVKNKLN